MKSFVRIAIVVLTMALVLSSASVVVTVYSAQKVEPDNTKVNKADSKKNAMTADKQSNAAADLDISKKIREAITQDKSLSLNAHNVKIITQDGLVTLKGPVDSTEEKQTIGAKAKEIAGEDKVSNQITIRKKKSS